MSVLCPHCGGAIVALVGANQAQPTGAIVAQSGAIHGANPEIAHGSDFDLDVDVDPGSNPTAKAYNKDYNAQFLYFWVLYPLKRDKRKAEKAWRKAVARLGANLGANRAEAMAQICAGAIRYRDDPNRLPEFTKYAEGWLNGDGWEDEPLPQRTNGKVDKAALIRSRIEEVRRGQSASSGSGGNPPSRLPAR